MKGSILVIGEDNSYYRNRLEEKLKEFNPGNLKVHCRNFDNVLKGKLPASRAGKVITMLFYPKKYNIKNRTKWAEKDKIYGGPSLGKRVNDYHDKINRCLCNKYEKRIEFVNPIYGIKNCRDKDSTKKILTANGIPTPQRHYPENIKDLTSLLNDGKTLFAKVRFGGFGKAITYLSPTKQYTNFKWNGAGIENHGLWNKASWPFIDVSGNTKFLKNLLEYKEDLIFEEGLNSPLIDKKKFDLRIYVIYNKAPHILPRSNDPKKIVTNWCQGGTVEEQDFLKKIPKKSLDEAKKSAIDAAKAIGNLKYVGFDILFSKNYKKAYVLEGQTDCGLPKKRCFDALKYLAKEMIKQFKK